MRDLNSSLLLMGSAAGGQVITGGGVAGSGQLAVVGEEKLYWILSMTVLLTYLE